MTHRRRAAPARAGRARVPAHGLAGPVGARLAAAQVRPRRHGVARDRRRLPRDDGRCRASASSPATGRRRSASTTRRRRSSAPTSRRHAGGGAPADGAAARRVDVQVDVVDPLADVLAELKGEKPAAPAGPARTRQVGRPARRRDGGHQGRRGEARGQGSARRPSRRKRARRRCRSAATSGAATCCKKTIKGSRDVDLRRPRRRRRRDVPRHRVRRGRRLLRRLGRRLLQLVLQRLHLDPVPAADPRRRGGAAAEGHR